MYYRIFSGTILGLVLTVPLPAQLPQDARFELIKGLMSEQAAARVDMPLGTGGVQLNDSGKINEDDLKKEIQKNGRAAAPGSVVTVTKVDLGDRSIEIELDGGGGNNKKKILDHIQIGVGGAGVTPQQNPNANKPQPPPKGSKVTLKFAEKVPSDLTLDRLKELLNPVLDFTKSNFLRTGIDALPPEFQEAVKAKEARIGMDRSTVVLAMGPPDTKVRDIKEGVETEDWIYHLRGNRITYVTFDLAQNVVVGIRQYGAPSAAK
jgi:hypothetical protein